MLWFLLVVDPRLALSLVGVCGMGVKVELLVGLIKGQIVDFVFASESFAIDQELGLGHLRLYYFGPASISYSINFKNSKAVFIA